MTDYDFFSGLQVVDIVLLETTYRVQPDFDTDEREMAISLGHDARHVEGEPSQVRLVLRVGVNDENDLFDSRGFSYSATVAGTFAAPMEGDDEKRKVFVLVNGLSLLYGEVRSYLSQFSSGSPLGRVVLPSVTMLAYLKAATEAAEASEIAE